MGLLQNVNADFKKILLETDPEEQMAMLTDRMKEKEMDMNGEPFPTFLKPYFVEASDRQSIASITSIMAEGLEKIGRAFLRDGTFSDIIELEGREGELARINPGYPRLQMVNRYDLFFNQETKDLKFLEFNCGDPSGMGWNDDMLEIFCGLPAVRKLAEKYDLTIDRLLDNHHTVLKRKYEQWCLNKGMETPLPRPNIAIICWKESTILGDFKAIARYYCSLGYNAWHADPADFDYDGKKLFLNGKHIHLIYRDALTNFINDEFWGGCQAVITAYRDSNVCLVNPITAATGDFKAILEIMTDDRYAKMFTPAENEAFKKHIPWTRLVRERKTTFEGKEVDLIPFISKNKDMMALKPNSGYGGFGAVMGWLADQAEWDATIEKALTVGPTYAVQQKVEVPIDEFPILNNGKLSGFEDRYVNINFWVHDGAFAGAFNRAASGQIVNVHQGGGLIPVFFVDHKL